MKTTVQITVLLLIGILFTVTSCTKDKNMDYENKDWNVLEWMVDGERAKANCKGDPLFGCDPVDCQYYHDTKTLSIYGTSSGKGGIFIYLYRHLKMGTNTLEQYDFMRHGGPVESVEDDTCKVFRCDTSQTYSLIIEEIDTINKIIVGTFSFTGIDNCQDTARVEDGYFKLRYRP